MIKYIRQFILLVTFLMACCIGGHLSAASATANRTILSLTTIGKLRYVSLNALARFYHLRIVVAGTGDARTCTLNNPNVKLEFKCNSRFFKFNGTQVTLSYPIEFRPNGCFIEVSDLTEFLDPLMRPASIPRRVIKTVMIDAGHGGNDNGAEKNGILEKSLNLMLARRVGAMLVKRGYRVVYTRTSDVALSLQSRTSSAAYFSPSLFLSIHCNSTKDASVQGIEVYISNPAGKPSFGTTTLGKDTPSTKFNRTNALWAYEAQRALIAETGAVDRGVKRKQYHVIRETPAPCMLVEVGFISNDAERAKLIQSEYQDKIATAICSSIDSMKKTLAPMEPKQRKRK